MSPTLAAMPAPALRLVPGAFERQPAAPRPAGVHSACSECRHRPLCLGDGLSAEDARALDDLRIGRRRVREGESVVLEGQPMKFFYAVRSGSLKTSISMFDGREHVNGFAFPGDLLGLDSMATGRHATTATALEDGEVCVVSHDALLALPADARGVLARQLQRKMGQALLRDQERSLLLTDGAAEPRVAAFLLIVSRRMRERGWSPTEFNLRMSRAEIGSYLGVTLETVSRALSAFARRGWVEVRKRRVRLLDPESLAVASGTSRGGFGGSGPAAREAA